MHSSFRGKHSSQIRVECDIRSTEVRKCIADDMKSGCTLRSGWEQHFVTGWFAKQFFTPELCSTKRIEWPIKNKKSSRCGRSLLTKWAFRSVSLFPVILRGYGAERRDNALHKDRNEYKDEVVLGKSNRDLYQSKEKSLMRRSEIMVVLGIKIDSHTLSTFFLQIVLFYIHIDTYTCGSKMRNDSFAACRIL